MPNSKPRAEERLLIAGLRDALKLDGTYTDADIVELAKIVSTIKLNPKALLMEGASLSETATDDAAIDRAGQLCVDAHAEYDALEQQERVAKLLAKGYQHGSAELGLPPDGKKANQLDSQIPDPGNFSDRWHKGALWHTRGRLWWLRAYRLLDISGAGFLSKGVVGNYVSTFISALGLSYFIEGFVDLYTLARIFFKPTDAEKTATPDPWDRLRNLAAKGSRPTRLWNFRWGLGNALDFIVTLAFTATPLTAAIKAINDLVWFLSDVAEEGIKGFLENRKCNRRLKIIEKRIHSIEQRLLVPGRGHDVELIKELAIWQRYHARAQEHKAVEMAKCWRALRVTVFLALGMAIFLIPQITPILVAASPFITTMGSFTGKMIGSAIALLGGSIYGGFGIALWRERHNMLSYMRQKITGYHPSPTQTQTQTQTQSPPQTPIQPADILPPNPVSDEIEIELTKTIYELHHEKLQEKLQVSQKNLRSSATDHGLGNNRKVERVSLERIRTTALLLREHFERDPKKQLPHTRSLPVISQKLKVVPLTSAQSAPVLKYDASNSSGDSLSPRAVTRAIRRATLLFTEPQAKPAGLTVRIPVTSSEVTSRSPTYGMAFPHSHVPQTPVYSPVPPGRR